MVSGSILVDKVHRNPITGIDWDSPPRSLKEVADISLAKIAGLWGIWAIIGGLYCVGRWYWDGAISLRHVRARLRHRAGAGAVRALCASGSTGG